MVDWIDRTVLEAASWRLASELVRRHPTTLRLIRAHPGGGLSDCLWILPADGETGDVRLNRNGTIQVLERFDGRPADSWEPTEWEEYLAADPREFLHRLETAAGLPIPQHVPPATATTLTYRLLAAIAATAIKSVHPIEIQLGVFDTSGGGGGRNEALMHFPIPAELLWARPDDLFGESGYRFWVVLRDGAPVLALEQHKALAWTAHHDDAISLMDLYKQSRRHLIATALTVVQRIDNI